jgi:hypothetical protein
MVNESIMVRCTLINKTCHPIKVESQFRYILRGRTSLPPGHTTIRFPIKNRSKNDMVVRLCKWHPEIKYDVGSSGIREL